MGEIADAMLDGTLCAGCGVALLEGPFDVPQGFPGYCSRRCAREHGAGEVFGCDSPLKRDRGQEGVGKKFPCPNCGKRFRSAYAASQHAFDKHWVKL